MKICHAQTSVGVLGSLVVKVLARHDEVRGSISHMGAMCGVSFWYP